MNVAEEADNATHFSLSVRTEFTTVVVCPLKIILSEAIEEAHVWNIYPYTFLSFDAPAQISRRTKAFILSNLSTLEI